jgi:hypothetical protein
MVSKDQTWQDELLMLGRAITAINRMTPLPRFVIVCGDLVNGMQHHNPYEPLNSNAISISPLLSILHQFISNPHLLPLQPGQVPRSNPRKSKTSSAPCERSTAASNACACAEITTSATLQQVT